MATQTRVPGAASSEVDFELERFERTSADRIEITGRWYGLRGRRFVRPVLNLRTVGGSRRRAIALLEHKPWAADDGVTWLAAFAWPQGTGEVEGAELEVGPGLIVDLPAPGAHLGAQGRVSAIRPHAPAPMARLVAHEGEVAPEPGDGAPREPRGRAAPDRDAERRPGGGAAARDAGGRERPVIAWDDAPVRERSVSPPRDVMTAAMAERDEAVATRDAAERDRIQALNERDDALSRRDAALRDADRAVAERDEAVAERERLQVELDRVTRERDVAHAERKRTLEDTETVARERDQAAAEREAARNELSRALPERDHALREAELQATRADQAEAERDTAFAERKSAVAQRDRARRERDRAMRAVGVDPPVDSPHAPSQRGLATAPPAPAAAAASAGAAAPSAPVPGATPPGTPMPSRPMKVIGTTPLGPGPEPKPLLTPVDSGRPRRLSRTRRAPSAPTRWAVRMIVLVVLIAVLVVLAMLLLSVV